jgi:hypothetical protein
MNRTTYVSILLFFAAVSGIISQIPPPPPPTPYDVLYPSDMIVSSDGKRISATYIPWVIVWDHCCPV